MPGTQPGQVSLEGPSRCTNCHEGFNPAVEPGFNWKGSMMAQSARDPLFWATFVVAAQDSIAVLGNPNAADLCMRCHFPKGWLEGRSTTLNASAMTGADYDGVQCDFCHRMYDPHFDGTHSGVREGSDWPGYWDEAGTLSAPAAAATYNADLSQAGAIRRFDGQPFFTGTTPFGPAYTEAGSGQYFVSSGDDKRASFADASTPPDALQPLPQEQVHVRDLPRRIERRAGQPGRERQDSRGWTGTATVRVHAVLRLLPRRADLLGVHALGLWPAGRGGWHRPLRARQLHDFAARQQDRGLPGLPHARWRGPGRQPEERRDPADGSTEHPNSGQPIHDLTGGNVWVPTILASTVSGSPNYDATNAGLLRQGPTVLTMDLNQGLGLDAVALLAGADRARQQLELAAEIKDLDIRRYHRRAVVQGPEPDRPQAHLGLPGRPPDVPQHSRL
jgi:hypothetical protein